MRKVVLMMSISVDGYTEGPDADISWHMVSGELHAHFNEHLAQVGAFLDGRVTHELMAGFWPTADSDPESTPEMAEFAGIWREKPKIVYSRSLEHADWNTTIVREVVPEEVMALKAQEGGDLSLGGAGLSATFLRLGLIDELRLYVHPVVIGRGTRLFGEDDLRMDLHLAETRTFANGVVLLRYERVVA
jgi:dihydrofolate reductase